MSKAISRPTEQKFNLDKYDPTGETYITIRQATQAAHESMSELYSEVSRVLRQGGGQDVEIKTRVSQGEVMRRAVFLTMVDSNLTIEGTKEGEPVKPLFRFKTAPGGRAYLDMTEALFLNTAWGELPPDLAEEMYNKVLELNPMWGKAGE